MTTGELTALHWRLSQRFLKLAGLPWEPEFETFWFTWLFEAESRMISKEWARAWERQSRERKQDMLDFGYHHG